MNLLTPLGLLGLFAIAVLILIYIIKPNYQQKIVSSTHIWKLSLKYRKKRIPISKFRNILLIICQILILSLCAFLLAQPIIEAQTVESKDEKIVIIDASAGMLASSEGETRFERAVAQVKSLATQVMAQNGTLSVILADGKPSFIVQRAGSTALHEIYAALDELVIPDEMKCSYGAADMESAMNLAESVLLENDKAEVLLYTGTKYIDKGNVKVVDVSELGEWNAAILGGTAVLDENYYTFSIDVASYNRDTQLVLCCDIYGVNMGLSTITLKTTVTCESGQPITYAFDTADESSSPVGVYMYDYAHIYLENTDDAFSYDDDLYLYGGTKDTIRVQYFSSKPNNFVSSALMSLRDLLRTRWDIELTEVRSGEPELEGFDVYIFEHQMPQTLPTDGVVLLFNLDREPVGLGLTLGDKLSGDFSLAPGAAHPITNYINSELIEITEYRRILTSSEQLAQAGFETLMYCGGDPVFLVKNQSDAKVGVLSFSLNKSTLAVLPEFPMLMYNFFDYFLPPTLTDYVFDVNEKVTLNARGPVLTVTGPGVQEQFENFPNEMSLSVPGIYTSTQTLMSGKQAVDSFYVKIPAQESNIGREEDSLANPLIKPVEVPRDLDLLIYFASVLVALLFVEWLLQSREF